MFAAPGETPYDLRFTLLRIPVRVHPGFWLVSLIFAWPAGTMDLRLIAVVCLFVSILVHEYGHALVARSFGYVSWITLYWMGGLAHSNRPFRFGQRWRAVWQCFAGPFAGFVLLGIVLAVRIGLEQLALTQAWAATLLASHRTDYTFRILIFVNLWWGVVNLLPVFPLDGGQMLFYASDAGYNRKAFLRVCLVGTIAGGITAAAFLALQMLWPAILFGALAIQNYQQRQQVQRSWM